jgi:anthranilate phosphoribosyltransferase
MGQKLVDRVAQAQQLMAVADPDLMALFEEWLDELEAEVISLVQGQAALTARDLATKCGLSH